MKTFTIKPLEWNRDPRFVAWVAHTLTDHVIYCVFVRKGKVISEEWRGEKSRELPAVMSSIEDAKSLCQTCWENELLDVIQPTQS